MTRSAYKGFTIDIRSNDCRKVGSPWALYSAAFVVKALGESAPLVKRKLQGEYHTAQYAIRAGTDAAKHLVDEMTAELPPATPLSTQ